MLDFNHRPKFTDKLNACIDEGLVTLNASHAARDYLGGSRIGHACERALQFEFTGAQKDDGAGFSGRTLRIFNIGHAMEDLASAGFAWRALIFIPAKATSRKASSSGLLSQTDASAAMSTASSMRDPIV